MNNFLLQLGFIALTHPTFGRFLIWKSLTPEKVQSQQPTLISLMKNYELISANGSTKRLTTRLSGD